MKPIPKKSGFRKWHIMLFFVVLFAAQETFSQAPAGLFFDDAEIPRFRLRYQQDALFSGLRARLEGIDREAELRFLQSQVRYNDHLYDLARVANFAADMAFHYLFTGNPRSAELAKTAVRTLMKFPLWDYFLEGEQVMGLQRAPAATIATVLTIEFLGDQLDQEERIRWLQIMAGRGLEPCYLSVYGMRYPNRVKGWHINPASTYFAHRPGDRGWDLSRWPYILDKINLKAVPASGLAIGALAYRKYLGDDQRTKRWLEQAIFSISSFRDLFEKDGSYQEGVSYAHYTSLHLLQAMVALERQLGIELYDLLNWPGYIEYLHEMSMPTASDPYSVINFGDVGQGALSNVAFWTAGRYHDPRAQWFGKTLARGHDQWSLLWYRPEIPEEPPPAQPHLFKSDLQWIVGRTGYEADDLVVALRSGGPTNHEHADRNSIILKAFGEQLIADPHRPPYSFSDPSWIMRHTLGHSAVLIDGEGHQYNDGREGTNPSLAHATLIRAGQRQGYFYWSSDATPAYRLVNPDVESITRTVVTIYDLPALVVLDKVRKKSQASRLQARYFCYNNDGNGHIEAGKDGFTILRPRARLLGRSVSNAPVAFISGKLPIPAERAQMHPFVEVRTREPVKEPFLVTVLQPVGHRYPEPNVHLEAANEPDTYRLEIAGTRQIARISIRDSGLLPEIKVNLERK